MAATRERPILFSGPMVRAILDNRKTQTRRVVKPPKDHCDDGRPMLYDLSRAFADNGYLHVPFAHPGDGWQKQPIDDTRIRHYAPWDEGDLLWVRETWATSEDIDGRPVMVYRAGGTRLIGPDGESVHHGEHRCTALVTTWRPSIYMPRWASRLTLEITAVRVERLKEISEADAIAEGIVVSDKYAYSPSGVARFRDYDGARVSFAELWNAIYAKADRGWDANPWVWVLAFRRIKP